MKRNKIIYWVFTIIFAGLMLFSAIPNIMVSADSVKLFNALGYPNYLINFIGWAKALGVAAILIPGYPRAKEWAYAGLFFDLIGATYSAVTVFGFDPQMLSLILWFGSGVMSYIYYHKTKKQLQKPVPII
jgi:hypothetical protein